jgi:hypothetical protein
MMFHRRSTTASGKSPPAAAKSCTTGAHTLEFISADGTACSKSSIAAATHIQSAGDVVLQCTRLTSYQPAFKVPTSTKHTFLNPSTLRAPLATSTMNSAKVFSAMPV